MWTWSLEDGELLCAFLDDVYLCEPETVRFLYDLEALTRHAIQLHQRKTVMADFAQSNFGQYFV